MFMPLNMFGINIQFRCFCRWICLNGYAEDSQRYNHPIVMPKTVNGITTQLRYLCRWICSVYTFNLDVYVVEYVWMIMPCQRQSTWIVMPLTVFGTTIQLMFGINIQLLDVYAVEYVWMVITMTVRNFFHCYRKDFQIFLAENLKFL
jgi:hypothetical protein